MSASGGQLFILGYAPFLPELRTHSSWSLSLVFLASARIPTEESMPITRRSIHGLSAWHCTHRCAVSFSASPHDPPKSISLPFHRRSRCAVQDGKTPLHFAAQSGHLDLVIALLGKNAAIEATDSNVRVPHCFDASQYLYRPSRQSCSCSCRRFRFHCVLWFGGHPGGGAIIHSEKDL